MQKKMRKKILTPEEELQIIKDSTFPLLDSEFVEENFQIKEMLEFKKSLTDEEFGFYLAGLFSSDGSFSKKEFRISFHISDISLAYYLKNKLGFGYITKVKGENTAVYRVYSKKDKIKILNLINGKFYTESKLNFWRKYNYETE